MKSKLYLLLTLTAALAMGSLSTNAQGTWTQKANFGGTAREYATGFAIGTKGYIGTGFDPSIRNDFWEYDTAANTWTQKSNFGGGIRNYAAGFAIGTKGYIGTGYNGNSYNNDFWEYDPAANIWTQKANFGGGIRYSATGFTIGTKGYLGMGNDGSGNKNDFWEYDQGSNTWTQKSDFGGTARVFAVGFAIGTKGYIGTGSASGASGYTNDFWEYDPAADTWTQKANFGGATRRGATGFAIGTKGYIGTGVYTAGHNVTYYTDFWEYNQGSNIWTQKANFGGTGRLASVGFSIGTKGYIGTGGKFGSIVYNDFWEYTPDSIATGVEELNPACAGLNAINIYPNPLTSEEQNLSYPNLSAPAAVSIFNTDGKEVVGLTPSPRESGENRSVIHLKLPELANGIYIVVLMAGDKRLTGRFVKE